MLLCVLQKWMGCEEDPAILAVTTCDVLLARGRKEERERDPEWQTPEGRAHMEAAFQKEFSKLIHEQRAWKPVSI